MSERARREPPEAWSQYVEAVVELTRAEVIERGDVGAAAEHARRALSAARAGADVLSVGALATLSQAQFFAGDLDESRRTAVQAIERPDAPDGTNGYVGSLGLLALIDAEQGQNNSAERSAREAIGFAAKRTLGWRPWRTSGWRWRAPRRDASTRPSARRRGERLRRSPHPTVGHAHALLVLAQVRVARSRLGPAASDLRARTTLAEFPDPGRLPALAAKVEQAWPRQSEYRKRARRRGAQCRRTRRAALPRHRALPTRDRRAAVHLAEHGQDPHPRAVPQAGRDIGSGRGRPRRSARPTRANRITRVISGPDHQNAATVGHAGTRMSAHRYRVVVEGELGPRYASAFDGMTLSAHDGRTESRGRSSTPRTSTGCSSGSPASD